MSPTQNEFARQTTSFMSKDVSVNTANKLQKSKGKHAPQPISLKLRTFSTKEVMYSIHAFANGVQHLESMNNGVSSPPSSLSSRDFWDALTLTEFHVIQDRCLQKCLHSYWMNLRMFPPSKSPDELLPNSDVE